MFFGLDLQLRDDDDKQNEETEIDYHTEPQRPGSRYQSQNVFQVNR